MSSTLPGKSGNVNQPSQGKVIPAAQAVHSIRTGATVAISGSGGGVNDPSTVLAALEQRFITSGQPVDLILYHPSGMGDGHDGGTERFAHPGMVRLVYGSHWSWAPRLAAMAVAGAFEVAVWPQGVLSHLLRESAAGRPGLFTQVGMDTYLDPRVKLTQPGRHLRPQLIEISGRTWLYYPAPRIDVAVIRATTADEFGNLSMEQEGVIMDALSAAQAAHCSGGTVIAQVKRLAKGGALDARMVRVPGHLVDAIVVDAEQRQSFATSYNPSYGGELATAVPTRMTSRLERQLIARRAALELRPGMVVNLGFGIADGVAITAALENVLDSVTFTIEQGASGGIPAWDSDFGLMWNPTSILDEPSQFDFYDGGGLDLAVVSFAQVDARGNVNVSYFNQRLIGPGGFINITQAAKAVVFCGTMTAKGLQIALEHGRLRIEREGAVSKFLEQVDEITFSAEQARARGQQVLYVTERAVFRLGERGLELIELAPGIDLDAHVLDHMAFRPDIASPLRPIPQEVYSEGSLGLKQRFSTRS
jgi:propionate CoA-transferase